MNPPHPFPPQTQYVTLFFDGQKFSLLNNVGPYSPPIYTTILPNGILNQPHPYFLPLYPHLVPNYQYPVPLMSINFRERPSRLSMNSVSMNQSTYDRAPYSGLEPPREVPKEIEEYVAREHKVEEHIKSSERIRNSGLKEAYRGEEREEKGGSRRLYSTDTEDEGEEQKKKK